MAQVAVTINGRKYQIACDDGQEAHLARLGDYVDKRIHELVAAVGQIGDVHLLVMASLLVADELSDAYSELEVLRDTDGGGPSEADDGAAASDAAAVEASLVSMAERIENIAQRLKAP
jgi:cell division protein ZapA